MLNQLWNFFTPPPKKSTVSCNFHKRIQLLQLDIKNFNAPSSFESKIHGCIVNNPVLLPSGPKPIKKTEIKEDQNHPYCDYLVDESELKECTRHPFTNEALPLKMIPLDFDATHHLSRKQKLEQIRADKLTEAERNELNNLDIDLTIHELQQTLITKIDKFLSMIERIDKLKKQFSELERIVKLPQDMSIHLDKHTRETFLIEKENENIKVRQTLINELLKEVIKLDTFVSSIISLQPPKMETDKGDKADKNEEKECVMAPFIDLVTNMLERNEKLNRQYYFSNLIKQSSKNTGLNGLISSSIPSQNVFDKVRLFAKMTNPSLDENPARRYLKLGL